MKELNQSGPEGDRNPKLNQEILQEMMQLGEKAKSCCGSCRGGGLCSSDKTNSEKLDHPHS